MTLWGGSIVPELFWRAFDEPNLVSFHALVYAARSFAHYLNEAPLTVDKLLSGRHLPGFCRPLQKNEMSKRSKERTFTLIEMRMCETKVL